MNKKYWIPILIVGNLAAIYIVSSFIIPSFKGNVLFDEQYQTIIDGVYLNPDLVDQKPDMRIDKQKFLDNLNNILPPAAIFSRFGGGYHEFHFELGITKEGKLGSIQIKKEYDLPSYSTIGDYLGSQKFVQALSEISYIPAQLDGKSVGSIMTLMLIIAFDQKGSVVFPWYMKTSTASASRIEFFDKTMKYNESAIFSQAEVMPEIIGGIDALSEKIVYPTLAKRAGIEGKVILATVVDEEGKAIGVQLIKSLGAGLDEAAISAIRQIKFRPGKINGRKVKVKVVFPIIFKLNN